jgi:hypothetical protein
MIFKTKKNGFAPILVILIALFGIGTIVGLSYYRGKITTQNKESGEDVQSVGENQERINRGADFQMDNLETGGPDDLVIGEQIFVMGTENQDGSITAERVYIGEYNENSQGGSGFPQDGTGIEKRLPEGNRPSMPEGINPEEFRNLSMEERRERMQEIRGDNFSLNGQSDVGFARVRGEIINKDETSLTLKLIDGGSKFIFYSAGTQIMKIVEPAETVE